MIGVFIVLHVAITFGSSRWMADDGKRYYVVPPPRSAEPVGCAVYIASLAAAGVLIFAVAVVLDVLT